MTKIAIMGYGVVGKGVAQVFDDNASSIAAKAGEKIEVKYILDLLDFPGDKNEKKIIHDFNIILNDDEISVVCEVMGGKGAAYKFTKALLESGKSVVSSNKELVATYGDELMKVAKEHGVSYYFEASVGGGIPILYPLEFCLGANKVEMVYGIVNGTSNYILSSMKEGKDFATALSEAQKKGYAEADPTADIEGIDACRKICILAALSFGVLFNPDDVYTKGISGVTLKDITDAEKDDCTVRLIALAARLDDGKYYLSVAPMKVKNSNPLAGICGVLNGVVVNGNEVGEVMFYGPGAGSLPTASAVAADVMNVVRFGSSHTREAWVRNDALLEKNISGRKEADIIENTIGKYM